MIAHHARARSGITLTEILIAILIMGVGLISLATLFPIGMVRLRDAARQSRSALLAESVIGDMGSKNLLDKSTFAETYYGNNNDPWLVDSNPNGAVTLSALNPPFPTLSLPTAVSGIPVCYDPLWRSVTGYAPPSYRAGFYGSFPSGSFTGISEARFGAGIVSGRTLFRADPDGNTPSAHGLQRITNFVPWCAATSNWPFTYRNPSPTINPVGLLDLAESTFVSPEDMVMQNNEAGQAILLNPNTSGTASGVVPMFFQNPVSGNPELRADYRYSWLFTGRQIDVSNGTVFDGDIVVMENRPFALESVPWSSAQVPAGETTVEAVFGPGGVSPSGSIPYYAPAASQTVLLRWPSTMDDPEIKVGSWIADVTYERVQGISNTRQANSLSTGTTYPMQRCYWYQISKKTDIISEYDAIAAPSQSGYRRTTIYTTSPLRAQTLLTRGGNPVNVNAALIMPSVVNVFSKTFYVR